MYNKKKTCVKDRKNGLATVQQYNKRSVSKDVITSKGKSLAVILIASFITVFLWINKSKLQPSNVVNWGQDMFSSINGGKGFPCSISGETVRKANFKIINGNLVVLSDTTIEAFNRSSGKISSRQHSFSNPVLKVGDGRAITYDSGGNNYSIEICSKNIHKGKTPKNIMCCAISGEGTFAIVTESQSYLSEMTVFDRNNNEKYKYYFADYYVSDVAVWEDGESACVCGISAENGEIRSAVYIFDFRSKEPKVKYDYPDNMISSIHYFSNGNIAVIGDKCTSVINKWTGNKQDFLYDRKVLSCVDFERDSGIVCCLSHSNDGKNCELCVLDKNGGLRTRIQTKNHFTSISYRGDKIAGLDGSSILSYDLLSDIQGQWPTESDSKKVILASQLVAYVLGRDKISKVRLK